MLDPYRKSWKPLKTSAARQGCKPRKHRKTARTRTSFTTVTLTHANQTSVQLKKIYIYITYIVCYSCLSYICFLYTFKVLNWNSTQTFFIVFGQDRVGSPARSSSAACGPCSPHWWKIHFILILYQRGSNKFRSEVCQCRTKRWRSYKKNDLETDHPSLPSCFQMLCIFWMKAKRSDWMK